MAEKKIQEVPHASSGLLRRRLEDDNSYSNTPDSFCHHPGFIQLNQVFAQRKGVAPGQRTGWYKHLNPPALLVHLSVRVTLSGRPYCESGGDITRLSSTISQWSCRSLHEVQLMCLWKTTSSKILNWVVICLLRLHVLAFSHQWCW